jgi:16S rRNA (adenine1518-N6/adenine1519-N6)-dimethyltransferase
MKIAPKKSLGQNWLNSPSAIEKIVSAGELKTGETVLEIGPGRGALTSALLATGAKVIAVEKDHRLIDELGEKFASEITSRQLTLIEGDILIDQPNIKGDYKLIANIPYYITGEIIRTFLENNHQPEKMVLLVQKEVAKRIVASDKKESILSMSVKVYGTPTYVATVKAGSFIPKPKVDSAILAISNISKTNFKNVSEVKFFQTIKAGFAQKRKKLKNNLSLTDNQMSTLDLSPDIRAEDLTLANWLRLAHKIS